ncbi:hypothetical protein ACNYC7_15845 [Morganella morganii]|uniref:hypothetical protein n=1 Tax=Morganella morganii TaxID=582 RepID=UPI003AE68C4A
MKKIGDVTSTADKNGEHTNGNVAAGIAPTILEADWLNSVQREILGVIIAAGLKQDKNNDNQLVEAIRKIISGGNYAPAEDLKKYLAKAQNGADIPDTEAFIKNLGLEERLGKKRDNTDTIFKTLSYQPYDTQLNSIWLFTNEENADWRQGIARNRDGITGYSNFRSDHSGDVAHTNELLGFYQQWQDVTKERQGGVVYNNNTGRPICVFVRTKKRETPHALGVGGTVQGIAVGGSWAGANGQEIELSCFFIVPPGHNYSADSFLGNSGNFIGYWSELR